MSKVMFAIVSIDMHAVAVHNVEGEESSGGTNKEHSQQSLHKDESFPQNKQQELESNTLPSAGTSAEQSTETDYSSESKNLNSEHEKEIGKKTQDNREENEKKGQGNL